MLVRADTTTADVAYPSSLEVEDETVATLSWWDVTRHIVGIPAAHAIGAPVVVANHHGAGSTIGGAVALTVPTAGSYLIQYAGFLTDNGYGAHIYGTWTFELRKNGTAIDSVTVTAQGGEVADAIYRSELSDYVLNTGDALTVWAVVGNNPDSADEIRWCSIRIYKAA